MHGAKRQLEQCGYRLAQTDALQAADPNQLQREALARDKLALQAALGTQEEGGVPSLAELACHGEGGDDVAAGATARE